VPRDRAAEVIAGYVVVDDVSVRDWQLRTPTMTMGKSFAPRADGPVAHARRGRRPARARAPHLGERPPPESNTRQLIFDCFAQVEHLSTAFTLEPGDVVRPGRRRASAAR
jgi:2-keto-4-pentenoate hydratase/2-oxohepta-3-ene-1,7-dioic acid hydratase in catechol pathway